jgi:uncharacterized cupredoxin-like copper-binding protein
MIDPGWPEARPPEGSRQDESPTETCGLRVSATLAVALLATACSGTVADAPWTHAPLSAGAPSTSPAVSADVGGAPGSPSAMPAASASTGEVTITMTDTMRFQPDPIIVKAGEPITFVVTNAGLVVHEFVVGTEAEQADHAADMAAGGMGHDHGNAVSVAPGETGSLNMTFAAPGVILVGCHETGHYNAGMRATITIVD